jgi:hypothetical protein
MKPSFWRRWFAPRELFLQTHRIDLLIWQFSREDLWGAMFWLSGGVSLLIGGMGFSWVWALLVVCIVGALAYVGGYNGLIVSHGYNLAVRSTLAMLLGGGIGWGIGFYFFSAINSDSAYQVSFGSQVLALLLSFAVGLVPLFAVILNMARDDLNVSATRGQDESTDILSSGCLFIGMPVILVVILVAGLVSFLGSILFPWLHINTTWYTETDPRWLLVVFVGLGLFAAFAVGIGGPIVFLIWRLAWFGEDRL